MSNNQWYDIDTWQWTDIPTYEWGFEEAPPPSGLNQIWTDEDYVYAAKENGLDIIDIETEQVTSTASFDSGYTTVWASDNNVYLGTSGYGIKYLAKSDISPGELISHIHDYALVPDITHDTIRYIHGNSNKLIVTTVGGVDIVKRDSPRFTRTTIEGARKCFVTPTDDFYYTVSGTNAWYLYRLDGNTSDWTTADVARTYVTGSGILYYATCLYDMYITDATSVSGVYNTIFLATDDGAYVIDEGTDEYIIFTTVS